MSISAGGDARRSVVGWASVCRAGNYNAPHNHPDSAWSGVYYVDAGDPDEDIPLGSCLELLDPHDVHDVAARQPGRFAFLSILLRPSA